MTPADSDTEYAFWTVPGTPFTVTYSLPAFHEIDFQVNEGFRRIPHGGIEIGGLLFGRLENNSAKIEAFRMIDCEHASGPSFVLSDRDLEKLREQLSAAGSDPELDGKVPLGWFIAHTRSPLTLNTRESALFDQFFPEPGRMTILIKPEKFKPTRFAFLVRGANGKLRTEASEQAIILPLPRRAGRMGEAPVASIPAPVEKPPEPPPIPAKPRVAPGVETRPIERRVPEEPPAAIAAPTKALAIVPPAEPVPVLPSVEEIRRERQRRRESVPEEVTSPTRQTRRPANFRLALILILAASLGCAVGYLAYLQLPAATIPLQLQVSASGLEILWPPSQTQDSAYAAIRVNDGEAIPLSERQKAAGEAVVPNSGDNVKIELVTQHWMRDSRGIVRFVRPAATTAPVTAPVQ